MRLSMWARILFGASAALFGVVTLMWHDPETWQALPFLKLPFGAIVADALAIAQVLGGIGLVYPRTVRAASIILGVVYLLFALSCIPGMIADPKTYVRYGAFFEWFSLVSGAIGAYAITEINAARSASFANAARLGLGLCAISFAIAQIVYFRFTASLVPTWLPPSQTFWTALTTIAFALAAIAMLINRQAGLAIRLMTLMLALFGMLIWIPAVSVHPNEHGNWSEFALNFLITGATWVVGRSLARLAPVK